MLDLILAALAAVFRVLLGRWLRPKNPEVENLSDALKAKSKEAEALARPPGPWDDTVNRL
jgi:hypothetical protein